MNFSWILLTIVAFYFAILTDQSPDVLYTVENLSHSNVLSKSLTYLSEDGG